MPSALHRHQAHTWYTYMYANTYRQNMLNIYLSMIVKEYGKAPYLWISYMDSEHMLKRYSRGLNQYKQAAWPWLHVQHDKTGLGGFLRYFRKYLKNMNLSEKKRKMKEYSFLRLFYKSVLTVILKKWLLLPEKKISDHNSKKILVNGTQQSSKIPHNEGVYHESWLNIQKTINLIHPIRRLKKKSQVIARRYKEVIWHNSTSFMIKTQERSNRRGFFSLIECIHEKHTAI